MRSKNDNIEIMINDKANEAIEERFQSYHFFLDIKVGWKHQ